MAHMKNIYVAATGQHVGKTTSTLGIAAVLMEKGYKVGYCKPVGQQALDFHFMKVDKDAILFSDLLGFNLDPALHSPIILDKGATTRFLDNESNIDVLSPIYQSAETLASDYEIVIYEGTGHPGVGYIAHISNADVARMVNAEVILVVEGGIGNTIDRLDLCLPIFEEQGVQIAGVIVNKVFPDKIEKIKHYVGKKLEAMGLTLLGVLPYDKSLAYPTMETIADAIRGVVSYNSEFLDNKVEDIIAGSLVEVDELKNSQNLLLVVSSQRVLEAIRKIEYISTLLEIKGTPLAGIVATGPGIIEEDAIMYIKKNNIPLVRTALDTYGSVIKISKIEVKINRSTPWKVKKAIELVKENISMDLLLK